LPLEVRAEPASAARLLYPRISGWYAQESRDAIRRATRRQYSAEEKVRILIAACAAKIALRSCAVRKESTRTYTIAGRRTSWKPARSGWRVNPKRIQRLYTEDGLTVRTKLRKRLARRSRVATPRARRPNEKWSMDFMSAKLVEGRWFRVLTVIDQFTRECLALVADLALNGHRVALALSQVVAQREAPESIIADNGSEFAGKAMDAWAYQYGVHLEFIRRASRSTMATSNRLTDGYAMNA